MKTTNFVMAVALILSGVVFSGGALAADDAPNNLSRPTIVFTGGGLTNVTCGAGDWSDLVPATTPPDVMAGFSIDPALSWFVQGAHTWQAPCMTWTGALPLPVTGAWGDNLTGDAKLKVDSPIRVELVLSYDSTETVDGYAVEKLQPELLDRESKYGTLATDDGAGGWVATPSPFVPGVYDGTATLRIEKSNGTPVYDQPTTAEINAKGIVVYGYNLRVPTAGTYLITYTVPNVDFNGADAGDCGDAISLTDHECSLVITVEGDGAVPVAVADSYTVGEGATLSPVAPGVLGNDTDADGDALTAVKVSDPAHGTLTLNADGSFVYTHDGSETTSDSFRYLTSDGTADSGVATVTITVTAVNDAPEIASIVPIVVPEGECITFVVSATDPEGGAVELSVGNQPPRATFEPATGEFSWCTGYDQAGEYLVDVQASDGVLTATETVVVTVISPSGPVFADDFADGAAPADWLKVSGSWAAGGGVFTARSLTLNNVAQILPLAPVSKPIGAGMIRASVQLTSRASTAGPNGIVVFGYKDPMHYRWVKITATEVRIGQQGAMGGVRGGLKKLVPKRHAIGKFIPLTVKVFSSGWVQVFEGSSTTAVASYRFLSGGQPSVVQGGVSLAATKARTIFDNVKVWEDSALTR